MESKGTVVTGAISGPETPTEERTGSAINDGSDPECTPSTVSHQGSEKAVEYKEAALTNTASETTGGQKNFSDAVPNTTPPFERQKEPILNKELGGDNTASETAVAAAEEVRGPAVLEGSKFPQPPEIRDTDGAEQDTASQELSERTKTTSTEPLQKAPETQVLLGSSSKIKDSKTDTQVSNIPRTSKKFPSCNFRVIVYTIILKTIQVKRPYIIDKTTRVRAQCYTPNGTKPILTDYEVCFFF